MKVLGLFIAIYCSAFSVAANNGKGHTHSNGQGHESHGQGNGNGHDPNFTGAQCTYEDGRPNIVMFVADDFGRWGEDIMDDVIPNIIRMGSEGVILDNSYVLPTSSPTRSALLTGYMPHRTGMQFHTIYPSEGYGLPINFEILPQKLKELCYTTYAIGKWHLGFCADEYLPQNRGFDKFYGTYTSGVDYFDKTSSDALTGQSAYDLHQNDKTVKANNNKYLSEQCLNKATDLISEHDTANPLFMYYAFQLTGSPLQAPQEKLDKYNDENPERRAFKAMASVMDDAIQSVVDALQEKGMLDNTYIVFLSDNGGEVTQGGNNWQLRGNKGTLYEGAMRTPAFVWAKPGTDLMATGGEVADGFMHAVDWFPTILSIAGGINDDVNMDGKDQSVMLLNDVSVHLRTEFLYALDESMDAANKRAYR
ncbi:arylsulfatase J-like [Saccoglossus kowalevskii]